MSAAAFTNRTVFVPAYPDFGMLASNDPANAFLYPSGRCQYVLYTPSSAAVAAQGWTGTPYRLVINFPGSGSALTSAGANENHQMLENAGSGFKLGYGTAIDGSLATPDQNWPTLMAWIQPGQNWAGTVPANNTNRSIIAIANAIRDDLNANFGIDYTRVYSIGLSAGTTQQQEMIYGRSRWPNIFQIDWAGAILCATTISGSGFRQDLPFMPQNEASTPHTIPRVAKQFKQIKTPMWWVNSTGDTFNTPANYNGAVAAIRQFEPFDPGVVTTGTAQFVTNYKAGQWFRFTEYSGTGAPDHQNVWDEAYGNDINGGAMNVADYRWAWLMSQQFRRHRANPYDRKLMIAGARGR
jgi:predicted peptidase